jgi:hypothetical protein
MIIALIVYLFISLTQSPILPCLGDVKTVWLQQRHPRREWVIDTDTWALMAEVVIGENIWIGDKKGHFDMPDDARRRWAIVGSTETTTFEIWIYDSPQTALFYLLVMDDTEIDWHCGCGAWAVDEILVWDFIHPVIFDWFNEGGG